MASVLLVIHMFLALAIIGLVMLQRSEGGGLGIGGSAGLGGLATPQGTASLLSRATAICATGFFATSLALGAIAGHGHSTASLLDTLDTPAAIVGTASTTEPVKPTSEDKAVNDNKDSEKETTKRTTKEAGPTDKKAAVPSAPISE
jgi:preprotein translocase subunit SecG